jgi:hypothetical protein
MIPKLAGNRPMNFSQGADTPIPEAACAFPSLFPFNSYYAWMMNMVSATSKFLYGSIITIETF